MQHYDAIIVGAGQAGPPLAGRLVKAGQKIALVERYLFGGSCVNFGCIPTKTLVASARAARMVQRAADFGVVLEGGFHTDMKRVKKRMEEESGSSREHVESWLKSLEGCTVYQEQARFTGPKQLRVGEDVISADRIFLDVGARASVPPIPGLDKVPYLTNSSMLEIDTLPKHLIVLGAGPVGLEFAQMYRRFGSYVTVISHGPNVMEHEDSDVSEAIQDFFSKEGIRVILNAEIHEVQAEIDGIVVDVRSPHYSLRVTGSNLLVATGRRPNTDDLGLDAAGIETDHHGYIKVDEQLRTSCEGVWAMGGCNGQGGFTHTAYNDFQIVACNLLDGEPRGLSDRIPTFAVYVDPPLGRAGMNKRQARESGKEVLIARRPMSRVARAKEKDETEGFMEVLIDAQTEKILGATVLGTGGDEIIHSFLDMMYADAPYTVMQRAVHIHPTVSELIPTMLGDLKPLGTTAELVESS